MDNEKTTVTVDIYGNQFKLTGHSNPDYIKRVAAFVNETMNKLAKGYPRLDLSKIAVLAAVHLAEEVFRLERESTQLHEIEHRYNVLVTQFNELTAKHEEQVHAVIAEQQAKLDKVTASANHEVFSLRTNYEEKVTLLRTELANVITDSKNQLQRDRALLQETLESAIQAKEKAEQRLKDMMKHHEKELTEQLSNLEQKLQSASSQEITRMKAEYEREITRLIDVQAEAVTAQLAAEDDKARLEQEKLQTEDRIKREQQQAMHVMKINFENELKKEQLKLNQKLESHQRLLQQEAEQSRAQIEQLQLVNEQKQRRIEELEFNQLQLRDEYEKLKNEYHEWIELFEKEKAN